MTEQTKDYSKLRPFDLEAACLELAERNIRMKARIEDFNNLPWYRRIFKKA